MSRDYDYVLRYRSGMNTEYIRQGATIGRTSIMPRLTNLTSKQEVNESSMRRIATRIYIHSTLNSNFFPPTL
jgi:hypothetical protein